MTDGEAYDWRNHWSESELFEKMQNFQANIATPHKRLIKAMATLAGIEHSDEEKGLTTHDIVMGLMKREGNALGSPADIEVEEISEEAVYPTEAQEYFGSILKRHMEHFDALPGSFVDTDEDFVYMRMVDDPEETLRGHARFVVGILEALQHYETQGDLMDSARNLLFSRAVAAAEEILHSTRDFYNEMFPNADLADNLEFTFPDRSIGTR